MSRREYVAEIASAKLIDCSLLPALPVFAKKEVAFVQMLFDSVVSSSYMLPSGRREFGRGVLNGDCYLSQALELFSSPPPASWGIRRAELVGHKCCRL